MKKVFYAFSLTVAITASAAVFMMLFSRTQPVAAEAPAPQVSLQATQAGAAGGTGVAADQASGTAARQGCSCCGTSSSSLTAAQKSERIQTYLTDYFSKSLGDGVTVVVRDLGCHHEADVLKDGQIVKKLSINGNTITEIT